jgi:hypothetical protein
MNRRLPFLGGLLAVAVVVVTLAVVSTRGTSSSSSSSSSRDVEVAASEVAAGDDSNENKESSPTTAVEAAQPEVPYTTPNMPMSVSVSTTEGLVSGDVVSVKASPSNGSQAFGVEARLCRGDVAIAFDGQMFPTRAGLCIPKPFAQGTDSFIEVANQPPYGPVAVNFTVGTGSQTFTLQDGTQTTITCDSTHPCQLVLKLQYPNGFGFQGVPLAFR